MSKHGATSCVIVKDNIDYALKRLSRLSSGVISEHKKATDHYEKPSAKRHQERQSMLHKLELERDLENTNLTQKRSIK
ncbi:MAG: bS21 family ribosomal protein, partial [Methanothrix sp.]|nr:bS21 family ribosomal protein [Methanothrix sp.]